MYKSGNQMLIAVIKETAEHESRVALTPDIVKRLTGAGIEIVVEKKAGEAAGFLDDDYKNAGAAIAKNFADAVKGANVVAIVSPLNEKQIASIDAGTNIIGMLKPFQNSDSIKKHKRINQFALEFVPRISRAQSMDVLSSQSNLAGYRAVIEGAY